MSAEPLFSVIIPTQNRKDLVREALASVMAQTVQSFEVIVVDDGSELPVDLPSYNQLRVIRLHPPVGVAGARNEGIRRAVGRYVTFLDDDDIYTPNRMSIALRGLARAPIGICRVKTDSGLLNRHRMLEGWVEDRILEAPIPHVGASAIERTLVPLFDQRFTVSEDVEWWLRLSRRAPVATEGSCGYLLRSHDGERQTGKLPERLTARLQLLDLHGDYFRKHPRAAAYQWKRVGGMAQVLGDYGSARRAYAESLRSRASFVTLARMLSSVRPARSAAMATHGGLQPGPARRK